MIKIMPLKIFSGNERSCFYRLQKTDFKYYLFIFGLLFFLSEEGGAQENLQKVQFTDTQIPNSYHKQRYDVLGSNHGIIRDTQTGLDWMRCSMGQVWNGHTCSGEANRYTYQDALNAAQQLNASGGYSGYSDWRVPSLEELRTLVYCSSGRPNYFKESNSWCSSGYSQPTIVHTIFPNTPGAFLWSATPFANHSSFSWAVLFSHGGASYSLQSSSFPVRLVRDA